MTIPLAHYLIFSGILFSIGLAGVLIRKNILVVETLARHAYL